MVALRIGGSHDVRMSMRTAASLFLVAVCFLSIGCRHHVAGSEASTDFVKVVNGTGKLLKVELAMDWDGVRYESFPSPGYMNPGVDASISVDADQIPVRTRVSWTDPGGHEHHQDVAVREHCAPQFKGDVVFTIRPDATVVLSFEPQNF
jgi:hypothetical protein